MANKPPLPVSFRLPQFIVRALDSEARTEKRTRQGQLEYILHGRYEQREAEPAAFADSDKAK
jgi:hypothetical protein